MQYFFTFYRARLRVFRGLLVGLIVAAVLSLMLYNDLFYNLRNGLTDALYVGSTQPATSGLITLVAVDDDSLAALGRSTATWSRNAHADLLDILGEGRARVISFDILFAEPSADDDRFVQALEEARTGIPGVKLPTTIVQPVGGRQWTTRSNPVGEILTYDQFVYPTANILEASRDRNGVLYRGHVNFRPDDDGFVRRVPLVIQDENGERLTTLALTTYLAYLRLTPDQIDYNGRNLRFSERTLITDPLGQMLIYYFSPPAFSGKVAEHTFPVYSYVDILCSHRPESIESYALEGFTCDSRHNPIDVPLDAFNGKIIMVGVLGAITEPDRFPVPVSSAAESMFGVEIHANIVENIHQSLPSVAQGPRLPLREQAQSQQIAIIFLLALSAGLILPLLRWFLDFFVVTLVYGAYFVVAVANFQTNGLVMELFYPAAALAFTLGGVFITNYLLEERRRSQINDLFQRYVSPEIARKIVEISDRGELNLSGEEREITVMFADIRGFTSLSEGLAPREVVELLNTFLERMNQSVLGYGGAINKYIGDNLMAFWNAPYPQEDHAWLAVQAGLDLLKGIEELNTTGTLNHPVHFGIGVTTGPVVVGNIGSSQRLEYTPIGDTVNVASRLSGVARGGSLLIGEGTYQAVKDRITPIGRQGLLLKGKSVEINAYEFRLDGQATHVESLDQIIEAGHEDQPSKSG